MEIYKFRLTPQKKKKKKTLFFSELAGEGMQF